MTHPEESWSVRTRAVQAGRPVVSGEPLNHSIVLASNVRASDHYARTHGTSTWAALEEAMGALEGGRCVSYASGMAAANALIFAMRPRIVIIPRVSYLGVRSLLTEWEQRDLLEVRVADGSTPQDMERAVEAILLSCSEPSRTVLWLESPANPTLEEFDVKALCSVAQRVGALSVVDSTFATPVGQQPLSFGATAVLHSGTKFIGGHSDLVIGLAVSNDDEVLEALVTSRTLQGAIPGSLEAFLALRGLRTLPLRYEAATETAILLARQLRNHPRVESVRQCGPMVSFIVTGGAEAADRVCSRPRLIVPATSLGGVETTMERRQKYPGDAHVAPGLVRMSVGLEDPMDLWADLEHCLS